MVKNEYKVTWKLYQKWMIENKTKGIKLKFMIFWCIMVLVFLGVNLFYGFSFPYVLMAIYCVYMAFFRDYIFARKQYVQLVDTYGCENWIRTITVSDEGIFIKEGNLSIDYKPLDVAKITEKKDKIWIILNSETVIRMYKSAFIEGSWEECKKLFETINGVEITCKM